MQTYLPKSRVFFGLHLRQWALLTLALLVPILHNAVALWQEVGTEEVVKMATNNAYRPYPNATVGNPMPRILGLTLPAIIPLGLLTWAIAFVFTANSFQKQTPLMKRVASLVMALILAVVFAFVSAFIIPAGWLPCFNDYQLGLPGSSFAWRWSWRVVLPITAGIIFWILSISGNMTTIQSENKSR